MLPPERATDTSLSLLPYRSRPDLVNDNQEVFVHMLLRTSVPEAQSLPLNTWIDLKNWHQISPLRTPDEKPKPRRPEELEGIYAGVHVPKDENLEGCPRTSRRQDFFGKKTGDRCAAAKKEWRWLQDGRKGAAPAVARRVARLPLRFVIHRLDRSSRWVRKR